MSENNSLIYINTIEKGQEFNNSSKELIKFKSLDNIKQNQEFSDYSQIDYKEGELLGKFLKKFVISISSATGKKSNEVPIYLHNNDDNSPHYAMTEDTYENYKNILDTMDLVIFTYGNNEKETSEDKDKRLQHFLKTLDKIQEEQGN